VEGNDTSSARAQRAGISQGCPLSPFLFVILMTVVVSDSVLELGPEARTAFQKERLRVLLYADDTLLMGDNANFVQQLLDATVTVGARFGLTLHCKKFQLLRIRCPGKLMAPDGTEIPSSDTIVYLGATLDTSSQINRELNKKIGLAWGIFAKLLRLWNHSSLCARRKCEIFQSVITSGLLYGFSSAWLNAAEVRRLNGFQARCLRRILRIQPSFVSRVSNKSVLERARQTPYSALLLRQLVVLFGKIARAEDTDILRSMTFCPGSLTPVTDLYVRNVGRPRNEWAKMLVKEAPRMTRPPESLSHLVYDTIRWRASVFEFTAR